MPRNDDNTLFRLASLINTNLNFKTMKIKSLYLTVIAAILFAAGSITFIGCGNNSNNKSTEHQHEATEAGHQHDMDDGHEHEHGDMAEAGYQCPMKCEGDKTYAEAGNCPVCKMELKKVNTDIADAHYQCPMKCEGDKTYDEPGNCPVCKMEFKKIEGHNAE